MTRDILYCDTRSTNFRIHVRRNFNVKQYFILQKIINTNTNMLMVNTYMWLYVLR